MSATKLANYRYALPPTLILIKLKNKILYIMNLQPLSDHLIVKPIKEETTKSGILMPENAQNQPEKGEVIAVGPGRLTDENIRITMSVGVGNKILFKKYSPETIKVDGEEYLILTESEVIAIINE
jgi:chaperonin GroES